MQRFTELRVWQLAHRLAIDIYKVSASFPADERFGLTAQLRRAALAESEALLLLARDLGMASEEALAPLLEAVDPLARMLAVLRTKVDAEARSARC